MSGSRVKRIISLAMGLIFLFTVAMPGAGFSADNDYAKFSSSYSYIKSGEAQNAGTTTVQAKAYADNVDAIQIKLTLPSGVEFTDKPDREDIGADKFVQVAEFEPMTGMDSIFIKSDSSSITLRGKADNWTAGVDNSKVTLKVTP
ncbi:hypothetical protein [Desulfallas thermosapovorans]|uniref:Uncharacterized protein n=1 Tax=Desulfallas thermosapovorans DSM 6562 TaxID=1121431 RepID=A0A5S4ZXR6_9FIRM|nr:hypothetical protein [Desulfallas thermosapovorans]TYO96927.1 hypothetical protein LX24_00737 [Desulfallas thermosapovorans DSM 6562]